MNGKTTALVQTNTSPIYNLMAGRIFGIPTEFYWLIIVTVVELGAPQPAPTGPERIRDRRQQPGAPN